MIKELEIVDLRIPFKIRFEHNTAKRNVTQSIIIVAKSELSKGYGEGCPREYVTNESVSSAIAFFKKMKNEVIANIHDLDTLKSFKVDHHEVISKNHSIWCAIEMALIDLFAKQLKCSAEQLLGLPELSNHFQYTAVVGDGSMSYFKEVVEKHLQIGFTDFKIKINGNKNIDYEKLTHLRAVAKNCTVRLDANNIWTDSADVINYIKDLPFQITGIEEPLASKNIKELIELSSKISPPIILDESFNSIDQLKSILKLKKPFIINLRVSKIGGILNSLAIVRECTKNNIPVIIGAQVGETSMLTRAALTVANIAGTALLHQEGAYGTLLLNHDMTAPSLMFGQKGILNPHTLLHHDVQGFQLKVTDSVIVNSMT
jgi:L-alanine-DL-glutamate epimerase-like enolase superfamily enzyme